MKQFFDPLAEPVGAIWCLMALSMVWLLVRRRWRCAIWLGVPTVLLFLVGSTSLPETLVAHEEHPWTDDRASVLDQPPADAVVALGGGQRISYDEFLGFAMEDAGSRVLTAVQLVRLGKARTLVLGGSWPMPGKPHLPSICVVQRWIVSWGLAGGAVTNLGICVTTHDEAVALKKLAQSRGWKRVLLVTSALHMKRSVALFRKEGIQVTPVAADFHVEGVSQDLPFSPFPRQHRLYLMTLYLHEKIGWWVYRLQGWL